MSSSVEWAQIFERYRHLSRDFQQKFQSIQGSLSVENFGDGDATIKKVRANLEELDEVFQDFNSWLYVSLLEDLEEAKKNNAVGLLEVSSKIKRIQVKFRKKLESKRLRVETDFDKSLPISTYITFFEQLVNLFFQNAFKYSPAGSSIIISTTNKSDHILLEISSPGPVVESEEMNELATKGFRSSAAIDSQVPGEGYGLFNCKRISELLNIDMKLTSQRSRKYEFNNVDYCDFSVRLKIPYEI